MRSPAEFGEVAIQGLANLVGPPGGIGDGRDDYQGGIRGPVDGLDDSLDVVEDVLLPVPVVGLPDVVGPAADDEAPRDIGQLRDGDVAKVLPPALILGLGEGSAPADVGKVGGYSEALVFSPVVVDEFLIHRW